MGNFHPLVFIELCQQKPRKPCCVYGFDLIIEFLWQKDVDSYNFIVNCGDEHLQKQKCSQNKSKHLKNKTRKQESTSFLLPIVTSPWRIQHLYKQISAHTHTNFKKIAQELVSCYFCLPLSLHTTYLWRIQHLHKNKCKIITQKWMECYFHM